MTHRISFLGLGTMGYPMAGHLANAGHQVNVFNRTHSKALQWENTYPGRAHDDIASCLNNAEIIAICVGADRDVEEMVQQCLLHAPRGTLIIDHTTTSAHIAETLAAQCQANNLKFGHGQLTKMINQICVAGVIQGLAEGIHLGESSGLDMNKVFSVITNGAAGSWQMQNRHQTMLNSQYDHGFAVDWMVKDLDICLEQAQSLNVELPTTEIIKQYYQQLQANGGGRWDTSALLKRLKDSDKIP